MLLKLGGNITTDHISPAEALYLPIRSNIQEDRDSVKIGGCEALTDAKLAKNYGVSILMSTMIESRFALEKFLDMAASIYDKEEQKDTRFLINIETLDAYRKIEQILSAENLSLLDGIVIGRTDLSSAIKTDDVDSTEMLDIAKEDAGRIKKIEDVLAL